MPFHIHRPRQVIGLIYILMYISIFFTYTIILKDSSWVIEPKFTIMVIIWFILSFAVKVTMFMNRAFELLNLAALVAVMSIAFFYVPQPPHLKTGFSSIEYFCFYLNIVGGSACDFFDFVYEGAARPSTNT